MPDRPPRDQPVMSRTLVDNIDHLADRRRRDRAAERPADRLADAITRFTGSIAFVALHLVVFGGWIGWNLWGSPKFDPSFVVLAMVASVEAIFLSTFVLISQNRMGEAAERRAELDLQVNLLAEHELSRLATLVADIAGHLGVEPRADDLAEIEEDVSPDRVLDALAKADRR